MNNKLFISHKNTHLRFYNFILSTKKSYSVFLISCICFFFSTNPLIAQSVSLNFNNASYEQIFNTIEQKTGYKFVYNTQEINKHSLRSITIKDKNRNAHKGDARFRELVILRLCHFAKTMRQKSKLAVAQTVDFWRITQNART